MIFKDILSQRIGMEDIREILRLTKHSDSHKQELYDLIFDNDDHIAASAAWIFTHFSPNDNKWLYTKHDELIDEVLICTHNSKRRLILTILYKQPFANPPRVDLLDFCFARMLSAQEQSGVQTLCIKIAYEQCLSIPELKQELKATLEMMEGELKPAIHSVRKNILKAMSQNKSLQKIR